MGQLSRFPLESGGTNKEWAWHHGGYYYPVSEVSLEAIYARLERSNEEKERNCTEGTEPKPHD